MNIFVKCICPSCFNEIYLGDCRILSTRTSGKEMKGLTRDTYHRISVEPLTGPRYTTELARRQCYECRYLLPYNIELVRSITIVVVGDVSSGKSHYLASFIHQLKTEWINNATNYVTMECLTKDVEQHYIKNYFEPLFTHGVALAPTDTSTSSYARPLIYELAIAPSPRHPVTSTNLMLYDTSGEDYIAEDRLVNFARFVLNTDAFIFVVNSVVIPEVFSRLDATLQQNTRLRAQFQDGQHIRPTERLNAILSIYGRHHGRPKGSPHAGTPVAVMVAKSDLLPIPPNAHIKHQPHYGGDGVDLRDIASVDDTMRELLQKYYRQGDLVSATSRLDKARFFATSATGALPDANDRFPAVKPLRCLDPVLWILYELGIIKGHWQ